MNLSATTRNTRLIPGLIPDLIPGLVLWSRPLASSLHLIPRLVPSLRPIRFISHILRLGDSLMYYIGSLLGGENCNVSGERGTYRDWDMDVPSRMKSKRHHEGGKGNVILSDWLHTRLQLLELGRILTWLGILQNECCDASASFPIEVTVVNGVEADGDRARRNEYKRQVEAGRGPMSIKGRWRQGEAQWV